MSEQPPINDAALEKLHHLGGPSFVVEMLDLFFSSAHDQLEKARVGGERRDWRAVEMAAHTLQSSARGVGAQNLQTITSQIERLAREQQNETLPDRLRAMEEAYAQVKPLLEARRHAFSQTPPPA